MKTVEKSFVIFQLLIIAFLYACVGFNYKIRDVTSGLVFVVGTVISPASFVSALSIYIKSNLDPNPNLEQKKMSLFLLLVIDTFIIITVTVLTSKNDSITAFYMVLCLFVIAMAVTSIVKLTREAYLSMFAVFSTSMFGLISGMLFSICKRY